MYLEKFPDSITGLNLKACNYYKLFNGKAAETELKSLQEISPPPSRSLKIC